VGFIMWRCYISFIRSVVIMDNNVIELFPKGKHYPFEESEQSNILFNQIEELEDELIKLHTMTFWQRIVFVFTGE